MNNGTAECVKKETPTEKIVRGHDELISRLSTIRDRLYAVKAKYRGETTPAEAKNATTPPSYGYGGFIGDIYTKGLDIHRALVAIDETITELEEVI